MAKLKEYKVYIDADWHEAASGKRFESYNPFTGEPWASVPECGEEDVNRAVRPRTAPLRRALGRK